MSERDRKLVDLVNKRFDEIQSWRRPFDERAFLNLSFYMGFQWYNSDLTSAGMDVPPHQILKSRPVNNRIRPKVRTVAAKLTTQLPKFSVIPKTTDPVDVDNAKLSELVVADYKRKLFPSKKVQRIGYGTVIFGDMYLKIHWDTQAGKLISFDGKVRREGDVAATIINPFEIFPDKAAIDLEDARWIIYAKQRPLSYIKDKWPDGDKVTFEKSVNTQWADRIKGLFSSTGVMNADLDTEQAIVKEYWEKPTPKFPRGRVITTCNQVLLNYKEANPYKHGKYPFVNFCILPSIDRWWNETFVTDLIQNQRLLNKQIGDIVLHHAMFKPKVMIPRGANINPDAYDNVEGEIIEFDETSGSPFVSQPPPIAHDMFNFMSFILGEMDNISGIHAISEGQQVPQNRTASGMAFLLEADNAKHTPPAQLFEESWEKAMTLVLETAHQFAGEDRILSMIGPDLQPDIRRWSGADLATDVKVVGGSLLSDSKILRFEQGMALLDRSALSPDRDIERERLANVVDLGDFTKPDQNQAQDISNAKKENHMILEGQPGPPVKPYHNHSVHLAEHYKELKRVEYDETVVPMVKMALEAHCQQHEIAMQPPAPEPTLPPQEGIPVEPQPTLEGMIPFGSAPPPEAAPPEELTPEEVAMMSPPPIPGLEV